MIEVDGKILRNLQEQVDKNKDDIETMKFGLNIVGRVDNVPDLPQSAEIGQTYLVGKAYPYFFYMKTAEKEFTNLGKLESNVPGPVGPAGIDGEEGTSIIDAYINDDDVLCITFSDGVEKELGIVKGNPGIRGSQGEKGLSAAITGASASVDKNIGTPYIDLVVGGTDDNRRFDFNFHNLKGERGPKGDNANPEAGLVKQTVGTNTNDTVSQAGINEALGAIGSNINLFNPNDPDIIWNYYLDGRNESKQYWPLYFGESGFIPAIPGAAFCYGRAAGETSGGHICYYDKDKNFLSGEYYSLDNEIRYIPQNENIAYIRVPFDIRTPNDNMFYYSDKINKNFVPPQTIYSFGAKDYRGPGGADLGALSNPTVQYVRNIFNPDDTDVRHGGFLNASDGSWVSLEGYFETGFIHCKPGQTFRWTGADDNDYINNHTCFYDKDKNFLFGANSFLLTGSPTGYDKVYANFIIIPSDDRICYMRTLQSEATFNAGKSLYTPGRSVICYDSIPYNKVAVVSDYVSTTNCSTQIEKVKNVMNPNDKNIQYNGYLSHKNKWIEDGGFMETGYIPCKAGDKFYAHGRNPESSWYVATCYYDADKNFVKGETGGDRTTAYLVIPEDNLTKDKPVRYFRIALDNKPGGVPIYNTDHDIDDNIPYDEEILHIPHISCDTLSGITLNADNTEGLQWANKKWFAYGTSMTSIAQGKYAQVVQKLGKFNLTNKGIPGGSLTPDGYGQGNMKRAIMTLDDGKAAADLITIEVIPNEGAILGDVYDTDDQSFCGCLNQAIRYVQENTEAQIVVIGMIGSNTYPPDHTWPDDKPPRTVYDARCKVKEVAALNGVPYIDVAGSSGFGYGRVKNHKYQVDNIHLNELGGDNMGRFIWSKLKNIPTWKSSL